MLAGVELEAKAEEVSGLLGVIANPRRLLIVCRLAEAGEMTVSRLVEAVGLSQSALSQHLALMRAAGLLATRKEGLNVHYRIADPRALELMQALERIYCR
ncbi:MAG: transcriptional regulator [Hyphomicrobiales bacterium]|nr:transcriptional regulator [Hyphomicrobiales bacterium]